MPLSQQKQHDDVFLRSLGRVIKERGGLEGGAVIIARGQPPYLVRDDGEVVSSQGGTGAPAALEIAVDHVDTLRALADRRLSPQAAFLAGRLRFKGDVRQARRLMEFFRLAAAASKATAATVLATPAQWQPDGPTCVGCGTRFRMYRRRHHCRGCGRLLCAACSAHRHKDRGDRLCRACYSGATAVSCTDARPSQELSPAVAVASEGGAVVVEGDEAPLQELQARLVRLEETVEALEMREFNVKATLLRYAVAVVHAAVVAFIFALGALLVHYVSVAASWVDWRALATQTPVETCYAASYWVVLVLQVAGWLLYCTLGHGRLLSRKLYTFCVALAVIGLLRAARVVARRKRGAEVDLWWRYVHKVLGPLLFECMVRLKGVWVKCGQYLSSRADVIPEPIVRELSRLQDSVPASPFSSVQRIIERELGRPTSELFATLEEEALASASIAQVHRATLRCEGGGRSREVVVKVQHPDVRELLLEDLGNLRLIVRFVAWCDPDYNFRPIMEEWTSEARKELDFVNEAANLERVGRAMRASGLNVVIPEVLEGMTTRQVLVMSFCEGVKVTERAAADKALDRPAILRAVCEAFAYQIHIDGHFSGDPHPGNILLQAYKDSSGAAHTRPVLLDWGLAKTLPEHLRLAFCRFVYAASEHDFVHMLQSFEEMGMKLNRFDPGEDMRNIRFLMRDTAPPEEARRGIRAFHRKIRRKMQAQRPPVDAYPGELLFFIRVNELLHGLGARLHVSLPYLQVMAPYAQRALIEAVPVAERATSVVWPSPLLSPLEAKVRVLLTAMAAEGEVLGCQVTVYHGGRKIVDSCAGVQGTVDPRPVSPRTLFCCFSVSKAIASTALHLLVDAGKLSCDMLVADVWPEFGCRGKETTTIRHVLAHSTGLQHALPESPSVDTLCEWRAMVRSLEEAEPLWPPGSRTCYHYFSYGFLAGEIVERVLAKDSSSGDNSSSGGGSGSDVRGRPLSAFVRQRIFEPLGMGEEAAFGDADRLGALAAHRIATVEHNLHESMQRHGGRGQGDGSLQDMAEENGEAEEEDESEEGGWRAPRGGMLDALAAAVEEKDAVEAGGLRDLAAKLRGREYLLDPRLYNHEPVRKACVPSANGLFTARALATLFNDFLGSLRGPVDVGGGGGVQSGGLRAGEAQMQALPTLGTSAPLLSRGRVQEMRRFAAKDQSPLLSVFGMPRRQFFGLGYQLFGFTELDTTGNKRARLSGFGHAGVGGSFAFCDPPSGLAMAVTVNKITTDRGAPRRLLELVCAELGVGEPAGFFA